MKQMKNMHTDRQNINNRMDTNKSKTNQQTSKQEKKKWKQKNK